MGDSSVISGRSLFSDPEPHLLFPNSLPSTAANLEAYEGRGGVTVNDNGRAVARHPFGEQHEHRLVPERPGVARAEPEGELPALRERRLRVVTQRDPVVTARQIV